MFYLERAVLRLPEFSLFLFRLVPCEPYFVKFYWIIFLQDGVWLNRFRNAAWTAMQLFLSKNFSTTKPLFSFNIWAVVTLNHFQERYFRIHIFISILSPEPSNYDPWNSLLDCQFLNYLINKTIVLSNQQLVNFMKITILGYKTCKNFSKN